MLVRFWNNLEFLAILLVSAVMSFDESDARSRHGYGAWYQDGHPGNDEGR